MLEVVVTSAAGGGASVGRDDTGRAVFVEGALPGERVSVELQIEKKRFARGRLVEVLDAVVGRQPQECATGRAGCGGCDLAHATPDLQREMKAQVVLDALTRIARLDAVPDIAVTTTGQYRYRTTVRAAVVAGVAGYRRRWSHDVVPVTECLVAHPALEELLTVGRFGDATEVVLRVSAATGERLVVTDGDPHSVDVPGEVSVVKKGAGGEAFITEVAAGRSWRVSADSFFQAGPAAATALAEGVQRAVGSAAGQRIVDAYAGVGLFAGTVGDDAASLTTIEVSPSACADARVNLASGSSSTSLTIVESTVDSWMPEPADVVIADPSRAGLGAGVVEILTGTNASRFVLVSCDTGSLGRDVGLLTKAGYTTESVEIVDAFPETSHIETIVELTRH